MCSGAPPHTAAASIQQPDMWRYFILALFRLITVVISLPLLYYIVLPGDIV